MWLLSWYPAQACVQNKQYRHNISFDCKSHIGSSYVGFARIAKDGFIWLFLSAMSEAVDKNPWPTWWTTGNQPILLCFENRFDCCDQAKPGRDVIHTICSSIQEFPSGPCLRHYISNWCLRDLWYASNPRFLWCLVSFGIYRSLTSSNCFTWKKSIRW
jgi:hypothetical protein